MKLSVGERLCLLNMLPEYGDIITLRIIRDLQGSLGFSEEELGRLNFQQTDGKVSWDTSIDLLKEIDIGAATLKVIQQRFAELSSQRQLPMSWLETYDRFMDNKEAIHAVQDSKE